MWRGKQTADKVKPWADVQMVIMLLAEFRAPFSYGIESSDEEDYEEVAAQLILQAQPAIFDKPEKHQHLKALYMKGLVHGKPVSGMLIDGGAAVNLMPCTTFRKLGKGPEDLIQTGMMLKDFGGNTSNNRGAVNVELTIRSKTADHFLRH